MKKELILLSLLFSFQNVFAQCTEQDNFNVKWKFTNDTVGYEIKRKDGADFSYYKSRNSPYQIYNGIEIGMSIPTVNVVNFRVNPTYKEDFERVKNLLSYTTHLSLYTNSKDSSEIYEFPFEKNKFIVTKTLKNSFNIDEGMRIFTRDKPIFGDNYLTYYVILFHDEYGRKCSYFNSPKTKYDFGRKPLLLIWHDLWN